MNELQGRWRYHDGHWRSDYHTGSHCHPGMITNTELDIDTTKNYLDRTCRGIKLLVVVLCRCMSYLVSSGIQQISELLILIRTDIDNHWNLRRTSCRLIIYRDALL